MNTHRDELIHRWREGNLSEEELHRLNEALTTPEDRAAMRGEWFLEASLPEALRTSRLLKVAELPQMRKGKGWLNWRPLMAAAAALVIAGVSVWWMHGPTVAPSTAEDPAGAPRPPLAVVMQTINAEWKTMPFQPDDRVPAGVIALTKGIVRLQFMCGATVVIQGPAELDLKTEREAEVRSGLVTATVPPVAEGFTLLAAGWRAVDRGTVFGVDARSPEHAVVQVLEGRVDLHRTASSHIARSLTTGEGVRLSSAGGIEPAGDTTMKFPREMDIIDRAASAERKQFESWQQQRTSLTQDPSLVLYFDFEATDLARGVVRNLAPGATPGSDGSLIGGEWTQGRWPGKHAVAFQRAGDLVRVRLGATLEAATFVASVRLEPVAKATQTILLSPQVGPGQIYWMLAGRIPASPNGELVFIKTPEHGADIRLASRRGLAAEERGRWMQIAVVHDPSAHRVRHYLNGSLIEELPLDDATPLKLRQLVIGNWGFSSEPRNLVGRMDELAIFRRALDETEIRAFQTPP